MKKLLKPASIAFYFLMFAVFFIIGLYFAGFIDAGKGQGLAGGAIVVGWGVLFGGSAFIASFFIARYAPHKFIVYSNFVLLVIVVFAYGITHYHYIQNQNAKQESEHFKPAPITPTQQTEPIGMAILYKNDGSPFIAIKQPLKNSPTITLNYRSRLNYFIN